MLKKCSSLLLALALITVLFTGCRGNAKNENQNGAVTQLNGECGAKATLPITPDRRSRNGCKSSLARWALASCWTIKSSCA